MDAKKMLADELKKKAKLEPKLDAMWIQLADAVKGLPGLRLDDEHRRAVVGEHGLQAGEDTGEAYSPAYQLTRANGSILAGYHDFDLKKAVEAFVRAIARS